MFKLKKYFGLLACSFALVLSACTTSTNQPNSVSTESTLKNGAIPSLRSTGKPLALLTAQELNSQTELSFAPKTHQHLTIVTLWSPTWFDDHKTQTEALKKIALQYGSNLRIICLVYDTPLPTAQKFIKNEKLNFEMALGDQQLYKKLEVKSIPSYWFLDSDGNLLTSEEGLLTYEDLQKLLKTFVSENTQAESSAPPLAP